MSVFRRLDSYALFAMLFSLFAVGPLLAPGYFWGAHDARHSVYFLLQFERGIQDGILYPRWQPDFNFGYGYPFFNIYSPGAFYLGMGFRWLGFDHVEATKAVFALGFVLSALSMYLYARRVLGSRAAALVAAVAYVYIPYHLADVFLRAALAETLCFVFFPLVLLGFHELLEHPRARAAIAAGGALAGLIWSHYAVALLFLPFLGLYILAVWLAHYRPSLRLPSLRKSAPPLIWATAAGVYGALLAAVVLVPAALEYRFVRTDQWAGGYYSYTDHFVYLFQFFAPTWGYGPGSVAGPYDTLPFQLGAVAVVLAVLAVPALLLLRRQGAGGAASLATSFHLAATAGLMLLMLGLSQPVWEALRLATFAQFPWRLLSLTTLTMGFLSGAVVMADERLHGRLSPALLAVLLAVIVFASSDYLQPEIVDPPEGPVSVAGLMRFQRSSGEMTGMTAWATRPRPPDWSPLAEVYARGGMVTDKVMRDRLDAGVQAVTTRHTSVLDDVHVIAPRDTVIAFHTAYYPGWRATVDGQPVEIQPTGELGHITVAVPAGEHTLVLRFGDTPPRNLGAALTLLAAVVGSVVLLRRQRRAQA